MQLENLIRKRQLPFELSEIDLFSATDHELVEISRAMGLNLSLEEMKEIERYFARKGRLPTDVELQSLAQAWSEHCCYKSSKVFLREHIFNIDHPDVIAKGDAGVMVFDNEYAYALRIESHNHPSAVEPYGGAATGIGGIVRDVLCMGAQPVALIDPLFFGPLDYDRELPPGTKHPKYLLGGVVAGIRDYGNRIGIPTLCGAVFFDERYIGNCLVNVGCVGIVRRDRVLRNAVKNSNDVLILVGGKTGRDGIHGVTFASAELDETSEEKSRGAVQLGDPIMKEPLIHACLEVNAKQLISGMKDLGGGGLSCVVGELALAGGCGAEVDLDKVPLKETGLAPWEIWVSESQERMMLSAPKENVAKIIEIFDLWDVPATVIGRVIEEKVVRLFYNGTKVFELDLDFYAKGPEYCRPILEKRREIQRETEYPPLPPDLNEVLLRVIADPNIASKEWIIRQYDHEVRSCTVIKPLQGKIGKRGAGDAAVIKPLRHSNRGLAIAVGVNPWFTALDPYRGGLSAIDEICRNLTAVGSRPHAITDCLNFGNPEKPERLWEFKECVRGIGDALRGLQIAAPSGNVSFYNETPKGAALPTPTVMGVGIVDDVRRCVTADFKEKGNPVYVVGKTKEEMGGSALFRIFGGHSGLVPDVDLKILSERMQKLRYCINESIVRACHDVSDGGISVAIAEMCISGDIGFFGDLKGMGEERVIVKLFSESNSRWIVEVDKNREDTWKEIMGGEAIKIGTVGGKAMVVSDGSKVIDLDIDVLREHWSEPLWRLLG
ncbi:MAG: phosphoribosylformylglycinamidine synthase subunit PurL [Methanomassiliicoccales archaeon]|jgi:phosphoribosylformylglycinamidine synthase|nr:phosphoribosylformylglycinamidine synthase subunit PurL [Methanomassiliicoccales archaeon]